MIELLYFEGCPGYRPLIAHLRRLVAQVGADHELVLRAIDTPRAAQRERFLGSPTIRVDGVDVVSDAGHRRDFGVKCRLYRTATGVAGVPPDEWIVAALARRCQ